MNWRNTKNDDYLGNDFSPCFRSPVSSVAVILFFLAKTGGIIPITTVPTWLLLGWTMGIGTAMLAYGDRRG
jgi:hypothetical protein